MPGNFRTLTVEDILRWPTPNYTDPPEQRLWLGVIAVSWQIASTTLVWGRMWLRIKKRAGPFGIDDALIFLAWIFSILFTAAACFCDWQLRIGRHIWNFPPAYFAIASKVAWLTQVTFLLTMLLTKCSVLLCYRRMAKVTYSKIWMYAVWSLIFLTAASSVSILFAYLFMCQPLRYYWDFLEMDAYGESHRCINGESVTIATGTLTIASDLWVAALPCAIFYHHDMGATWKQKILINCLFCAGFLVTGVGIARTYYLWKVGVNEDLTWYGYDLWAASVAEIQLAIICTCAPFVRSFLREYFPSLVETTQCGPQRGPVSDRTTHTTTARGSYVTDEKGMVVPRQYSLHSPTGDVCSLREEEERAWARHQVQQSDSQPQQDGSPFAPDVSREAPPVGTSKDEARPSLAEDGDQHWARAQVQAWAKRRPVRDSEDASTLPSMSPEMPGHMV